MQRIMILGAGTMGAGIAQVVATAGYSVVLKDISDGLVRRGFEIIEKNLGRAVEKGKMTADRKGDVLGAIVGVSDPVGAAREASDCDLVIEAILEDIEAKKAAYRELDAVCPSETVFATNTSALSVSGLAASTGRPDRFLGLHFFNPVPVMQIVEVVPGLLTSERTLARGTDFVKTLGKTPLPAADSPGFIVNRILLPMINEAAYALMEGVANSEDIDTAMKLGTNHTLWVRWRSRISSASTFVYRYWRRSKQNSEIPSTGHARSFVGWSGLDGWVERAAEASTRTR
jgi:3-hydroxybutyryl-CoA dehydrogenase